MSKRYWSCFKTTALALLCAGLPLQAQSLWQHQSARPLVADKRAAAVGDILTVVIQESNSASKDNNTQTAKRSSIDASIASLFFSPAASKFGTKGGQLPALKTDAKQEFTGGGKISNTEKMTARIAVRVIDVLPNGNLVIEGVRQIAFSGETQDAVLRGVVRKEDVTSSNTIFSYQIADATIKYISKGTVSDNQRKGWFTKVWDKVTPF
ncbi:MAG TPA: flagellar basal body L-ring protein FlgH [Methylomirabilota bacterium]|nr:flagellar basal body L-ring protein FlgH [Methylomirabilota bacterium]